MGESILFNAVIFLGASMLFVPIAKKLGIGSVLGYIIAGIAIGPYLFGFIGHEGEDIMHAAEFGVVMMLFLIGLELNPSSFWKMRKVIVGYGGLQILITAVILIPFFYFVLSLAFNSSIAMALSFALSSTAIVLQTLKEKSLEKTEAGKTSFAVLLFQDIAVIPILAILPFLAEGNIKKVENKSFIPLLDDYPSIKIFLAVAVILVAGKFLISPLLRFIAKTHIRDLFTSSALFIVIGVAYLMQLAGLSAALGTFMAGVLLANSEYRHELESNIEPFKGLLLGLFFMAVGSTINFYLIVHKPAFIFGAVLAIMAIKSLVLYAIARFFKTNQRQSMMFTLLLSQVGEFAFVLIGSASGLGLLNKDDADSLMAIVTISMILSPVFLFIYDKVMSTKHEDSNTEEQQADEIDEHHQVIIAGFGHFGNTVGRFLRANNVSATILDNDIERVLFLRKMGFKVFYGDATRMELLESAGAANAKVFISTLDSPETNAALAAMVQKHFPHLKLFIRAKNRFDAYELIDLGVKNIYRESLHSSVNMGIEVLHELGQRSYTLHRKAKDFIKFDEEALHKLAKKRHHKESYIIGVREEIEFQESLLKEDKKFNDNNSDTAWDKTPLMS